MVANGVQAFGDFEYDVAGCFKVISNFDTKIEFTHEKGCPGSGHALGSLVL